jgi:hypothetical protein
LGAKAVKTGEPTIGRKKLPPRAVTGNHFLREEALLRRGVKFFGGSDEAANTAGNFFKKSVDYIGEVNRIPGRVMIGEDEGMKAISLRMEKRALAWREARRRAEANPKIDFEAEYAKLQLNPSKQMQKRMLERAEENTFQQDLSGYSQQLHNLIQNAGGGVLKFVAPFSRITLNLLDFQLQSLPGLRNFSGRFREIVKNGTPEQKAMMEARMVMGSTGLLTAFGLAHAGVVKGRAPREYKAKQMKDLAGEGGEYEIVLPNGTKIPYEWAAPFGAVIGIGADLNQIAQYGTEKDFEKAVVAATAIVGNYLTPDFLTESFGKLFQALDDPESSVAQQLVQSYGASAVPFNGALRQVRKGVDDMKRVTKADPTNDIANTWELFYNSAKNTIPGLSDDLLPARNLHGDPITYPPGIYGTIRSAVFGVDSEKHPYLDEVLRLQVDGPFLRPTLEDGDMHMVISMQQRNIRTGDDEEAITVPLSNEQYDKLVQYSAGRLIPGKPHISEELNKLVASPMYKRSTDTARKGKIKDIISAYYKEGREYLMATDKELQRTVQEAQAARGRALLGERPSSERAQEDISDDEALQAILKEEGGA